MSNCLKYCRYKQQLSKNKLHLGAFANLQRFCFASYKRSFRRLCIIKENSVIEKGVSGDTTVAAVSHSGTLKRLYYVFLQSIKKLFVHVKSAG